MRPLRSRRGVELLFVLDRHWERLGHTLDPDDFTDAQAVAAIERLTRGNFRLLERLFPQINRILKINELETITNDVVEAAASVLVIGYSPAPPIDHRTPPRSSQTHIARLREDRLMDGRL